LIHELEEREIAWRPLGSGSNVLADDGEHHYVIVSLKDLKAAPASMARGFGQRRILFAAPVYRCCTPGSFGY
jgi:UDP-N-acetylenolpyruvoylglucosamine reductase